VIVCFVVVATLQVKTSVGAWIWIVLLAAAAGAALHAAILRLGTLLILKPDEITLELGLFTRTSVEIGAEDINTIEVRQSLMQRILNTGDLLVASAGTGGYEINAHNMPAPYVLREEIQSVQRTAKSGRA
jgi:membrane protein YdbS with pleckstrin-like domain